VILAQLPLQQHHFARYRSVNPLYYQDSAGVQARQTKDLTYQNYFKFQTNKALIQKVWRMYVWLDRLTHFTRWVGLLLGVVEVIVFLVAYPNLPATIPTHMSGGGHVDGYGPKITLITLPLIVIVVSFLCHEKFIDNQIPPFTSTNAGTKLLMIGLVVAVAVVSIRFFSLIVF
jgi:uncharacterized membrane protein